MSSRYCCFPWPNFPVFNILVTSLWSICAQWDRQTRQTDTNRQKKAIVSATSSMNTRRFHNEQSANLCEQALCTFLGIGFVFTSMKLGGMPGMPPAKHCLGTKAATSATTHKVIFTNFIVDNDATQRCAGCYSVQIVVVDMQRKPQSWNIRGNSFESIAIIVDVLLLLFVVCCLLFVVCWSFVGSFCWSEKGIGTALPYNSSFRLPHHKACSCKPLHVCGVVCGMVEGE